MRSIKILCSAILIFVYACSSDQTNKVNDEISSSVLPPKNNLKEEIPSNQDPSMFNGLYSCNPDSSKKGNLKMGTLEFVYAGDKKLAFKIDIANGNCVGLADGLAIMDSDTTAVFIEKGEKPIEYCEIKFTIRPTEVLIEEVDCNYYHGLHCNFSNTYQRQNIAR